MLIKMKMWVSDFRTRSKSEKFSVYFTVIAIFLTVFCFFFDFHTNDKNFLFQRSGAVLTLAGIELQFAKITSLWRIHIVDNMNQQKTLAQKLMNSEAVGLRETIQILEWTRELTQKLFSIVADRDPKDVLALVLIVVGTIVWAFGDLLIQHLNYMLIKML